MAKVKCTAMSSKCIVLLMLGILLVVAVVGLIVTLQGQSTGKAVYSSSRMCPYGYTSYASDSPVLEAKQKAGQVCIKAAYPGWYCCETITG